AAVPKRRARYEGRGVEAPAADRKLLFTRRQEEEQLPLCAEEIPALSPFRQPGKYNSQPAWRAPRVIIIITIIGGECGDGARSQVNKERRESERHHTTATQRPRKRARFSQFALVHVCIEGKWDLYTQSRCRSAPPPPRVSSLASPGDSSTFASPNSPCA
ncbi:unnamed protein product, partial [Pleuronectes platessa]